MFIAVPHQRKPHFGHSCVTGDWNCEADCPGCRDRRDSHVCIGEPETSREQLKQLAREYTGHQALAVHALANAL
jgi:hypothetical protein